jgi:hypothetical protein
VCLQKAGHVSRVESAEVTSDTLSLRLSWGEQEACGVAAIQRATPPSGADCSK